MTRRTLRFSAAFVFALSFGPFTFAQAPMARDGGPADKSAERKPPAPRPAAGAAKPTAGGGAAAKPGAEAPSAEEIRQLASDGKHREALQKLSRALALKGDAATQYDRHELLRLKAESHLALKDTSAASAAFAAAAKEAQDDTARAEDKASELVVKRSKNLQYTPKPGKKGEKAEPIDIITMEKRKDAFAALLEEQKAAAAPALKAAKGSKSLPPIVDALKQLGDLRMLELAATGSDTEVAKLVEDLAGSALKLMEDKVEDSAALVDDIEASANDVQPVAVPARSPGGRGPLMYQSARKRGLTTGNVKELKATIADLVKLVPLARDLAQSLGEEQGKPFGKVADNGETVGNKAQQVLTTDYGDAMRTEGLRRPVEVPRR